MRREGFFVFPQMRLGGSDMLRDYQIAICSQVREAFEKHRSVMVQMPTGTGKTVVLAQLVKGFQPTEGQGSGILIVAHRRELIEQIRATIRRMGIERPSLMVESIQTISRRMHSASLDRMGVGLVVIDEAHHALAKSYRLLWDAWPEAKFLGLTATPWRMSGEGFTDLFEVLVQSQGIKRFIAEGWLCPYDYYAVRPDSDDLQRVDALTKRGTDGDYQTKEMREKLDDTPCIERLFATYQRHAAGKKGIVYAIDIAHAEHIAAYYRQQGVDTLALSSKTPKGERQEVVNRFREQGSPEVLVSVDLFSEGFDCPDVEFIQMARPTLSLAKYLQMVGRGLRRHGSKTCCILIDQVGLYRAFGLPSAERDWEMAFEGCSELDGQPHEGMARLERGMIPSSLLEGNEEEVVQIVSHQGMAQRFVGAALATGFERMRRTDGEVAWVDRVNGVTFHRRPRAVDFSGLELSTDDGILYFPRIGSALIDEESGIHVNLLNMQVGDGIFWKKRYISLSNPTQVYRWMETLPNGLRLFHDEQGRVFMQQDSDHPLVAEGEVSREEMNRRCNEEVLRVNRINSASELSTSLAWIKSYPIMITEETLDEEKLQRVLFADRKMKCKTERWLDMKSDGVYAEKPDVVKRGWVELLRVDGLLYVRNIQGFAGFAFPNHAIRADERLCLIGNQLYLRRSGVMDSFTIVRKSEDLTLFIVDRLYNRYMIINKPGKELEIQYMSKEPG